MLARMRVNQRAAAMVSDISVKKAAMMATVKSAMAAMRSVGLKAAVTVA